MTNHIYTLLEAKKYAEALCLLEQTFPELRDAEWYYLCYLAKEGLEEYYDSLLLLKTACEMAPDHRLYQQEWKKKSKRYKRQNADPAKKKDQAERICGVLDCTCDCLDCCI